MRRRLYDRGPALRESERHRLTDIKVDVSKDWENKPTAEPAPTEPEEPEVVDEADVLDQDTSEPARKYRTIVLVASIFLFICVATFSIVTLFQGNNQISSENINLNIEAPSFIGGGEMLSMQIEVDNQNAVAIESATLIVKYPPGTRSVEDNPRNLFEERIPISDLSPGETVNVPVSVTIFGDENDEKKIEATLEYRVEGSNSMFYKESAPLALRISSSPLVLRIDNVEKVASGQLVQVKVTAVSNASEPLSDILIAASYPNGFDFETADPEPVFAQNVWRIEEILPDEEFSIEIEGVISGLTEEELSLNFVAGPPDTDNQFIVGASLAEGASDFLIERPFINLDIAINDDKSRSVVLSQGEEAKVVVDITNTLDETVYDLVVEVEPGGNALNEDSIISGQGFYDSNRGVVRWEVSNNEDFERIFPGDTRQINFDIKPNNNPSTASFDIVINVYARRVAEESAQETLIGTTRAEAKYSATVGLGNQASLISGPVPPRVGEMTSYNITLVAEAGANDLTDTIVESSLPVYVEWANSFEADGAVTFNSVSKKLEWLAGNIDAGERKTMNVQLDIVPSRSQEGDRPVLINSQTVRANDRFTGALLQDRAEAVTTELSREMGYDEGNGTVAD